ncbi:MAG TPA: glycosyltransferase family 4 protein [Verrucomicrobiae bacterium]|jgi:glycosyltransferase involved in cell wall biosynthesis
MTTPGKSLLFVGAFPEPAALERYVSADLALRLRALGWAVNITSRHPRRFGRARQILWGALRHARRSSAVCVDVYSGPAFRWAEWACAIVRPMGKPIVLILRGGDLPAFSRRHPERVRRLLASAATVTCPSEYLLSEMRPMRDGLILLPNPLDAMRYNYRERQPPLRRLVWLRAFHEIYNPALAMQALGEIRKNYPDVVLTMIGPDRGDGSLQKTQQAAQNLGLAGAVTFTGAAAKQDVPGLLAQSDIFLNTTNFDNTPVSVMEAMASGLPVVSTNVGGIPWLLEDGKDALLVPPANAEAMAAAAVRLMREPELAQTLSRRAFEKVKAMDWTAILPRWNQLLENAIGGEARAQARLSESFSARP